MTLRTGDIMYRGRHRCRVDVQPDIFSPRGGVAHLIYLRSGRVHTIPLSEAEKTLTSRPPTKRKRVRKKKVAPE